MQASAGNHHFTINREQRICSRWLQWLQMTEQAVKDYSSEPGKEKKSIIPRSQNHHPRNCSWCWGSWNLWGWLIDHGYQNQGNPDQGNPHQGELAVLDECRLDWGTLNKSGIESRTDQKSTGFRCGIHCMMRNFQTSCSSFASRLIPSFVVRIYLISLLLLLMSRNPCSPGWFLSISTKHS